MDLNNTNICRLCLSKTTVSYSLVEEERANILESLTSIRVNEDDELPKNSCAKCWLNLKYAYRIQQNFLEANSKLNLINNDEGNNAVKTNFKREHSPELDVIENELVDVKPETIKVENQTNEQLLLIFNKNDPAEKQNVVSSSIPCKICGDKVSNSDMLEHTRTHFYTQVKCSDCSTYCEDIPSYRKHFSQNHGKASPLTCTTCKISFLHKPLYLVHREMAHKKPATPLIHLARTLRVFDKTYDCPYCKRKFRTEKLSLTHIATHQRKKCDVCGTHVTPSNFRAHYKAHIEGPVVCHICGEIYKNSISLRSHIHYTHSQKKFMCEYCQKTYKKSYDLLLHIKREHTGTRDHVCDECGKRFYTFYTLNKHKKMTHQKLRPFPCQFCKKQFSSKHAKVTHERQHTNVRPYKCDECDMGFRQNVSLKSHKKSAHNYVEEMTCACEVCGKKFGSSFAVLSHMRLH